MLKSISLYLTLFLIPLFIQAQDIPVPYEASANSAPAATTYFNFDISDSVYANAGAIHQVIYRDAAEPTWNSSTVALLYQYCNIDTYSGSIAYTPPSGDLEYYFRSENDTAVVSQSPKNSAGTFPPPDELMADLGEDPTGDMVGTLASNLDITHLYGTYSDNKLYFRLDNNGGGFPTSGSFFEYFIYSVGLINPNQTDSVAYAMVYADAIILSTGLFEINLIDSTFTNIGSVTTSISGNSLYLSCDISTLTAQPGWETWPPEAGFVGVSPVTITASLTDMASNDIGKSAVFMPLSHQTDFNAANTAPTLSNPSVTYELDGTVTAAVTYTDSDHHLPAVRSLYIDDTPYDLTACEKDYSGGADFNVELIVSESGWYDYYFEFSDGAETVTTGVESIYIDLNPYVCGDLNGDEDVNILDIIFYIDWRFKDGPAPENIESADVNNDGSENILDIIYLIDYKFQSGPEPDCG